jgi:hypothetical protein
MLWQNVADIEMKDTMVMTSFKIMFLLPDEFTYPANLQLRRRSQVTEVSDDVTGSAVSKTSTTARTTLASVNGTADPNFNSQLSVKGEY